MSLRTGTYLLPTPSVGGWTEEKREAERRKSRAEFERLGGTVISERRIRNTAFDKRGEKTTFEFVVEFDAA